MCNSLMLILTGKRECKIFKQNIDRNVFTLQIADHFTAVQCSDHYTDLSCCSCPRVFPWPGCSVRQRPAGAGQRHLRRGGQPFNWLTLWLELQQGRRETGHATVTNKVRYFEFLGKNNFEILWNSSRLVLMSKWKRLGFEEFYLLSLCLCVLYFFYYLHFQSKWDAKHSWLCTEDRNGLRLRVVLGHQHCRKTVGAVCVSHHTRRQVSLPSPHSESLHIMNYNSSTEKFHWNYSA